MRQLPKVLMLVENLSVPSDPRVWREAKTLQQHGFLVSVICPKGRTRDQASYECIDNIHIYRYAQPQQETALGFIMEYLVSMLLTFWLSLVVWRKHGFDVIHAANPPDTFFAIGLFYKLFGKKYIFDQHDLAPEMFRVKFGGRMKFLYHILLQLEKWSYRTADLVLTTNESQKRQAIRRGACAPQKVIVVRNGPELAHYTDIPREPARKQGQRFLLSYVGVMGSQDGVEYVLHALHTLVHRYQRRDLLLVLMGEGEQLPRLKHLMHELQLEAFVHFTGWLPRPEMLRYLAVTDIGLSPDPSNQLNDQSTMLKTMEYMAMGVPVVAFDLPETRFSAQEAALYATPNRVEEFAACIEHLLEDAALREALGAYGRQRIRQQLCWEKTREPLLHGYRQLFNIEALSDAAPEKDMVTV
uniref:Glycosyltransferase WbuB n=1 Tax=Thermosporothrix sp. COM3 TaxID=2490863 RepID=A0A455SLW7_9CHLR|nr:glycosyltransferase WbuB [Thermosporothrix sp. COM3]